MGISEVVDQKAKMPPPTPPTLYWRLLARVKRVFKKADSRFNPRRPAPRLVTPKKPNLAALKAEYVESGLDREADTFVLYRIIGNDLYPRHSKGQSLENVRFILENETNFENCEKRKEHGQSYLHIVFDWDEYRRAPWNFESFPQPAFFLRGSYEKMNEYEQALAEAQLRRHKNNYVMNNNGARNVALRDGRGCAKWVLPWDGSLGSNIS